MIESFIILACLVGFYLLRKKPPAEELDKCRKCGGKTEHLCGMGACVDMCPKCDRL